MVETHDKIIVLGNIDKKLEATTSPITVIRLN